MSKDLLGRGFESAPGQFAFAHVKNFFKSYFDSETPLGGGVSMAMKTILALILIFSSDF